MRDRTKPEIPAYAHDRVEFCREYWPHLNVRRCFHCSWFRWEPAPSNTALEMLSARAADLRFR